MTSTDQKLLKAVDLLVQQGKAEHVLIDGKPGIRLIKKSQAEQAKA